MIDEVIGHKVELPFLQLELPRGVLPLVKQQLRLLLCRLANVHSLLERGEGERGEPLRLRPLHVRLREADLQPRSLRLLLRTHQAAPAVDEPAAGRREPQASGRQRPNSVLGHEAAAAAGASLRGRRGQRGRRSRPGAQSPGAGPVQPAKCARRVCRGRRLRRGRGRGGHGGDFVRARGLFARAPHDLGLKCLFLSSGSALHNLITVKSPSVRLIN